LLLAGFIMEEQLGQVGVWIQSQDIQNIFQKSGWIKFPAFGGVQNSHQDFACLHAPFGLTTETYFP
jgi:hypothetical protein